MRSVYNILKQFVDFFQDAVCSGTDRVRRNAELGPNDEEVVTEFKPTFMSKGPILLEEDSIESVGKAEINKLEINFMTDNGKKQQFESIYVTEEQKLQI